MSRLTSRILSFWENNLFMTSGIGMCSGAMYGSLINTNNNNEIIVSGIVCSVVGGTIGICYPLLIPTGLCIYTGSQIGKLYRNDKNSTKYY